MQPRSTPPVSPFPTPILLSAFSLGFLMALNNFHCRAAPNSGVLPGGNNDLTFAAPGWESQKWVSTPSRAQGGAQGDTTNPGAAPEQGQHLGTLMELWVELKEWDLRNSLGDAFWSAAVACSSSAVIETGASPHFPAVWLPLYLATLPTYLTRNNNFSFIKIQAC